MSTIPELDPDYWKRRRAREKRRRKSVLEMDRLAQRVWMLHRVLEDGMTQRGVHPKAVARHVAGDALAWDDRELLSAAHCLVSIRSRRRSSGKAEVIDLAARRRERTGAR